MNNSIYLANTILHRAFDENIKVTNLKLQKLLYFVYSEYLRIFDKILLDENFAVWKYGPVLESVYSIFKIYGANRIDELALDSNGKLIIFDENKSSRLEVAIGNVWDKFKNYDGVTLYEITHKEGSAWQKAKQRQNYYMEDYDEIKNDNWRE